MQVGDHRPHIGRANQHQPDDHAGREDASAPWLHRADTTYWYR